ncbi:hypothetical protein Tco_1391880, partial [Tanacetum coccineum]
ISEAAQLKEATKRSQKDFNISQASGSGDGTDFESGVPNEQQRKTSGTDEETGTKSGVPDDDDNVNDDDSENEDDDGNDAHDSERTDSDDDDENPSFILKDYGEEEHDEESFGAEHEKERKGDEEMTNADQNVSQEKSYKQVIEGAHVTLTSLQKTKSSKQSSSVSSDFASKFLILDNVPPVVDEVASMMNVKNRQEKSSTQAPSLFTVPKTAIPKTSTAHATTIPPTISMITPLPQLTKPSPAPTTVPTTTSISALPDFFFPVWIKKRVYVLETELSQLKADHSAQLLKSVKSQLPTMVDDLLSTRIRYATRTALQSYTKEFEKKAQKERKLYIDVVEKSVKDIIKDESTINESLENVILAKSSSYPKSTYEAAESLTEFELKKILLDKMESSESYKKAPEHKELYEVLVKSYNLDKDLFSSYGNVYSLKRDRDDKDKDEDPSAGSDRGWKKQKTTKDAEPLKGLKSKESKTSSSKGTKSQSKSSGKSVQAKEPIFETSNTEMPQDQGGDIEDQHNVEATPMDDWFKKPNKSSTPDCPCNDGKSIDSGSATLPKQVNLLARPAFNLLKGTCKSLWKLEYHFKECYKAVSIQVDWNNPEVHEYPFDLSKPLSLIEAQGRQVVPANYFFNNDLEYLKGGSSSRKYTTSTTKTKAAKYDNIEGIEDMVPELWSPVKVAYDKFAMKRVIAVTHVKVMKWYGYGYLEEIIIRREDQTLHKFKEGDFPRHNLHDIEDLMLLLVQKKLSNLEQDVIFDKKLNITKPETFRSDISNLTPYTAYKNPQGIIYQDKFKRNRLMRSDELYKFCDGTLTSVRRVLHDIVNNPRMDYLPKRRWSNLDINRSRIMIKAIDQQLLGRRLMRNLEKFIGGREYRNDFRLLERTI